ncbi:YkgJ family cysteine cluster protein [Planctomycetota bacterium]
MMTDRDSITLLDKSNKSSAAPAPDAEVLHYEFVFLGKPIHLDIALAKSMAKLSDIVPLARVLSSKLAIITLEQLREDGETIGCCKYCSACCKYLVPLSIPEAFRLNDEIKALPEQFRQQFTQSFVDASEKILSKENEDFDLNESSVSQLQLSQISKWYSDLQLSCPLLFDDLCTLYEQRPLACREHIVTDSADLCHLDSVGEPRVVPMSVSILDALGELTGELLESQTKAVILPLALPWTQENIELSNRTWSSKKMVDRFMDIVKSKVQEYSNAQLVNA